MPYISKTKWEAVVLAGVKMSNLCFNLKQSDKQELHNRFMFRECQEKWDAALNEVRSTPRKETPNGQ